MQVHVVIIFILFVVLGAIGFIYTIEDIYTTKKGEGKYNDSSKDGDKN